MEGPGGGEQRGAAGTNTNTANTNANAAASVRSASVLTSVCNLANCAIGAGVLSLPYAVRQMGAALGAVLAAGPGRTTLFQPALECL